MPVKKIEKLFGDKEKLLLHQLRLLEWCAAEQDKEGKKSADDTKNKNAETSMEPPDKWVLTKGITLHPWQDECIRRWYAAGRKGTIKVVTGGGKTILGLALAESLQNNNATDLRVAIVAPTIVLMHQWYDEFIDKGNLPKGMIGRLGGGYKESFDKNCRVLICVLDSASMKLPEMVKKEKLAKNLLLIVDECHRAGATEKSKVFLTERAYSLGLSATPERDGDKHTKDYNKSDTGRALGRVVYELSYTDALKYELIPPFTIRHFGVPLNGKERSRYDQLTKSIREARKKLQDIAPNQSFFNSWVSKIAMRKGENSMLAAKYLSDVGRRNSLLFQAGARSELVIDLIKKEVSHNRNTRVILFHERIEQPTQLFLQLHAAGFAVILEHSGLPSSIRKAGLDLFRKGSAKVLVSVKTLIEGLNVPETDVGIIVASSGSPRQRIQSIGRVLRRHVGEDGEENTSCIYVIYVRDTTEEFLYEKFDGEKLTGTERNVYYQWTKGQPPIEQSGPPKAYLPDEEGVDEASLEVGKPYPGQYEGVEYSCDHSRNVRNGGGNQIYDAGELADMVINAKGQPGSFKVTPEKGFVLVWVSQNGENGKGNVVYAGTWRLKLKPVNAESLDLVDKDHFLTWAKTAKPGAECPVSNLPLLPDKWCYKKSRGGQIAKRIPRGYVFAKMGTDAQDAEKGRDAERLLTAVRKLVGSGEPISTLQHTPEHHVLYQKGGKLFLIVALQKGLEFPDTFCHD